MSKKKTDILLENVLIESVAAEGKAVARVDGMVVFTEFGVPGDVVDIQVFKKKKNYMEGFIKRLVKPSEQRQEPFCEHFGICGGCRWQLLPYSLQLEAKRKQVEDQLVRIGHLNVPEIRPTLPSEKTEYYRNKLEYSASSKRWMLSGEDQDKVEPGLGFHVGKFFDKVLDIKQCHLQAEPSNAIRLFIKQYCIDRGLPFYNIRENHGFLRNMFVRTTQDGQVMLIVCFGEKSGEVTALLDAVSAKASKVIGIEYVPEAIEDARVNARTNGIDNCTFFAGDMKDILTEKFIAQNGRPDVIILDPPRAGIHPDVAKVILKAAPERMVYVSCNPASQARDLAIFSSDYEITAVQPVDMFPHTQHVENVVALRRKE